MGHKDPDRRREYQREYTRAGRHLMKQLQRCIQCGEQDAPIMVGDTHYDVEGAAAHGIPTIGVSWGYGKVEDMENAGAKAIAHSMEELIFLLNQ